MIGDISENILLCVIMLIFGFLMGMAFKSTSITEDCEKLGGFYAGSVTYECKKEDK